MTNRRSFIRKAGLGALATGLLPGLNFGIKAQADAQPSLGFPLIVSTWNHGLEANEAAWKALSEGLSVLDAVEYGVRVSEADPGVSSVGYGGYPDAEGNVTLDACIMGPDGRAGSVTYLKEIMHAVSVARLVMEKTPHVILSGDGAQKFAVQQGFTKTNLLTDGMRHEWEQWKASGARYAPHGNWENHDTIGLLAMDASGDIAGACTTSGMAFKHPGRVGDSPIIGAGLFVDNEIGAATATGEGEAILKTLGSFLVVENMRHGMGPQEACEAALRRLMEKVKVHDQMQIGYIALHKSGVIGAYSLRPGFQYAVHSPDGPSLLDAPYILEW
jgi:isoaspartyl peptidase/L-asparaginase-like protein (Ntn-hydrolase superfamily)